MNGGMARNPDVMPAARRQRRNRMLRYLLLSGALSIALPASAAAQGDAAPPQPAAAEKSDFSFSGFATLGAVRSNTDEAQFVRYNQKSGARRDWDPSVDSILGLQASWRATPALSATVQALVRETVDNNYQPQLAWAFVRYELGDDVALRVGRVAAPGYLLADTRNIGYLSTTVRPSPEVYGVSQLDHIDGADLTWQYNLGTTTLTTQLIAGYDRTRVSTDTPNQQRLSVRSHIAGLSLTLENGPLLLRAGYIRADITVADLQGTDQLGAALTQAGYPTLWQQLSLKEGKKFNFGSLGLVLDDKHVLVQSEYVVRRASEPAYVSNTDAWYLLGGYRLGDWLPYVQHASLRQTGSSVTLPASFPTSGPLAQAIRYDLLTAGAQHTDTLGLRWTMAVGRALTVQVDRLRPTAKNGTLIGGPASGLMRPVMLLGVSFDCVF